MNLECMKHNLKLQKNILKYLRWGNWKNTVLYMTSRHIRISFCVPKQYYIPGSMDLWMDALTLWYLFCNVVLEPYVKYGGRSPTERDKCKPVLRTH
jgi:hypothetical protein